MQHSNLKTIVQNMNWSNKEAYYNLVQYQEKWVKNID